MYLVIGLVVVYLAFRKLQEWCQGGKCVSNAKLYGKTVVITGANTGIGKETVEDLVQRGASVIMLCRSEERASQAIADIKSRVENAQLTFYQMDLTSLESIRNCVNRLNEDLDKIDILVNNAGVMLCPELRTKEGFEMQIGTNHFGHFYLTNLLLPLLRKAGANGIARVVNVSSLAHTGGKNDWSDINWEKNKYNSMQAYNQSKLANVLFSSELGRREKDNGIHTYALHPGVVHTELGRYIEEQYGKALIWFMHFVVFPFIKTAKNGAQTTIYCCVDESIAQHTGRYYSDCKEKLASNAGLDEAAATQLWNLSVEITKLNQ